MNPLTPDTVLRLLAVPPGVGRVAALAVDAESAPVTAAVGAGSRWS